MATKVPDRVGEQFVDLHFPLAGVDMSMSLERQPARDIGGNFYARTTPEAVNVIGSDPVSGRSRGGSRSGLGRFVKVPIVADWIVQNLDVIVTVSPGVDVQQSNSGRVVRLVAVSQGEVFTAVAGATAWTEATNATSPLATPPLNFTGIMQSAVNNQKLYFADGVNWVYYDPSTDSVYTWAASAGALPIDADGNTPRLICTWRGRTVLSGLILDPHNWFMSRVSDPNDFDYAPTSSSPDQAIAGNNSPLGLIGDVVTALIPYTDDVLVVGGDHETWMFSGDPMAGGQIDLVSRSIGMAWGQAWCMDPYGNIYFFSNHCGIYTLIPGQQPQRISQQIEQLLQDVDTSSVIRLIWDDRMQGVHVYITLPASPTKNQRHFFYELRTGSWWPTEFANKFHDPVCCVTFDGNDPGDRIPLIGSWDGYVRTLDSDATRDDGTDIESSVVIGPILTANLDDMKLRSLQAVLGEQSGDVTCGVYVGTTAEAALASEPVDEVVFSAGRGPAEFIRRRGHAIYVKLSSTVPWAMETIRAEVETLGKVGRRSKH